MDGQNLIMDITFLQIGLKRFDMKQSVTFKTQGNLKKTWRFLRFVSKRSYYERIEEYAKKGVVALTLATPIDSGETASSWDYKINIDGQTTTVEWTNSSVTPDGIPIVILLQYGHATRNGGYVQGYDFINPALKPIFDQMVNDMWKEVRDA